MIDEIQQQLAESGAYGGAQNLLDQLKDMVAPPNTKQAGNQQAQQPNQPPADPLGDVMRQQIGVMDQTFRLSNQPGQSPATRERVEEILRGRREGIPGNQDMGYALPMSEDEIQETLERFTEDQQKRQEALGQLGGEQQKIQQSLREMTDSLKRDGAGEVSEFGSAQQEMGQAQEALANNRPGEALQHQEQALDSLRRGGEELARRSATNQPEQQGDDQQQARSEKADPLGRSLATQGTGLGGNADDVPENIEAQRAREILEAIRQRLSDPLRSLMERDYLERLLNPY
jgi:hypothetical protein